MLTDVGSRIGGVSRATGSSGSVQRTSGSGPVQCAPPTVTPANRLSTSGVRCFSCGETGHHQVDCKKQGEKALFVDPEDYEEQDACAGEELVFDGIDERDEEIFEGDTGPTLVVRHMCLTLQANEDE